MNITKCQIYAKRPNICRAFPTIPHEILEFPNCSYWFEGNERKGECCRCGECCQCITWPDGRDLVCRYKKKV